MRKACDETSCRARIIVVLTTTSPLRVFRSSQPSTRSSCTRKPITQACGVQYGQGYPLVRVLPLGSADSPLYENETLITIAKEKGRTPQQVLLAWGVQKGWSVLPKSINKERIEANWALDGWELTDEEMARLDGIQDRFKVCGDSWLPVKVFFGDDE